MKYPLLDGQTVDLSALPKEDLAFLLALQGRAMQDEDYFTLERAICGAGAYPLKGSPRVTKEIHKSLLYVVAEDLVERVGIKQGALAPNPGERMPTDDIVSVTEAASILGITRSAVIKAAQTGRIKGKKIGHSWVLLRRSVESYSVARHRVEAGRSARHG